MYQPLEKLGIPYKTYCINDKLEIDEQINTKNDEYLVYTNYFGLKDKYCNQLIKSYSDKLILDCSQAFYFTPNTKCNVFYSPRKYFGIPDGGILNMIDPTPLKGISYDTSFERANYLLKSIDVGKEGAYNDYKESERSLDNQPIKKMSMLTKYLMSSIDFDAVMKRRITNYNILEKQFGEKNELDVTLNGSSCPMVYPLLLKGKNIKGKLLNEKIYIATYWPNVLKGSKKSSLEYTLAEELACLPVDQRYDKTDMEKMIELINDII